MSDARATRSALDAAEPVDAIDTVTKMDLVRELDLMLEQHEAKTHLRDLNVIASPAQDIRSTFDLMPTATVDDWSTISERMKALPAAIDGYVATLRRGIAEGVVPARRQVSEVVTQIARYTADNGFFAEFVGDAAPERASCRHPSPATSRPTPTPRAWRTTLSRRSSRRSSRRPRERPTPSGARCTPCTRDASSAPRSTSTRRTSGASKSSRAWSPSRRRSRTRSSPARASKKPSPSSRRTSRASSAARRPCRSGCSARATRPSRSSVARTSTSPSPSAASSA